MPQECPASSEKRVVEKTLGWGGGEEHCLERTGWPLPGGGSRMPQGMGGEQLPDRGAAHRASAAGTAGLLGRVCNPGSTDPSTQLVTSEWIAGVISEVRDGEACTEGLCFFSVGSGEPLKVAEQGRLVSIVLGQQRAGWLGWRGRSSQAGSF